MFGPKKVAILASELVGTFVLSLVFYSMIARTSFPLFSGLAAGATLAVMIFAVGAISEAHLNPAVTISSWVMRRMDTTKAVVYIAMQMLGGLAAWGLISYFMGHSLTSLAGTKFDWRVFTGEALGTAIFAYGAASAMLQKYEAAKCAFVIGASYAVGIMAASLASNGILNPAVAVGIQSWDWSYAVGPIAGAVVGSNLYLIVYSAANAKTAKKRK